MKKKARKSNRNRHTGIVNSYKQYILDNAKHTKSFSCGAVMAGMYLNPKGGMSMVRAN